MRDETPQERDAFAKLDEATREVGWEEFDADRTRMPPPSGSRRRLWAGWRWWRWRDPEPTDEHGLRDALHGDADKQ
jgi:hypothetical protein